MAKPSRFLPRPAVQQNPTQPPPAQVNPLNGQTVDGKSRATTHKPIPAPAPNTTQEKRT